MKHIPLLALASVLGLVFVGCGKEDEKEPATILSVSQTALSFEKDGGSQSITVTANKFWTASSNQGWCKVYPSSGDGSKSADIPLTVTCEANLDGEVRTGIITVSSAEKQTSITVTQVEGNALIISKLEYEVPSAAQTLQIDVQYNVDYEVTVADDCKNWISVSETKSLSTKNYFVFVAENDTFEKREGTIVIKETGGSMSNTITIKQAQNDALIVDNDEYELTKEEQKLDIAVKSNLEYEVVIPDECKHWISVVGTKALNESIISLMIEANTETEERRGSVILKSDSIQQTITISQAADDFVEFDEGAFKTFCLENYDTNRDKKISYQEALSVTEIFFKLPGSCQDNQVSFKGIEHFKQLQYLHITTYENAWDFWSFYSAPRDVRLSNLNLNECSKLTTFCCNGWIIESLSLQDFNALNYLFIEYCSINELSLKNLPTLAHIEYFSNTGPESIVISDMPSLTSLSFGGNDLKELSINNSIALQNMGFYSDQFESLSINNCDALQEIIIAGNSEAVVQSGSITISDCNALQSVTCSNIQFESLSINNCDALQEIGVGRYSGATIQSISLNNCDAFQSVEWPRWQLEGLNISNCDALQSVNCTQNQLKGLNISNCDALQSVNCTQNQLKDLNISNCDALQSVNCTQNQLNDLNISNCDALQSVFCGYNLIEHLNISNFPLLTNIGYRQTDDVLKTLTLDNIGITKFVIDVPEEAILEEVNVINCSKLTDVITGYTGAHGPYISVLNIRNCPMLPSFRVDYVFASDINISDCNSLEDIWISRSGSHVKNLSISNCESLKSVYPCYDIYLESFNVNNCPSISKIGVEGNKIKTLDVSGCLQLKYLTCHRSPYLTEIWLKKGQEIETFGYDKDVATIYYKD